MIMPVALQTVCGVCPPCGVGGSACAIDRRQATVDADGFSGFVPPTIVATVNANATGGGADVAGGLPAVALGEWVQVDFRGPVGELVFRKYYTPRLALAAGTPYVGGEAYWTNGGGAIAAGVRVRRRDYLSGVGYYQTTVAVVVGLHDDPADDARFAAVGAGAGSYDAEFVLRVWDADVWGVPPSSQRPLGFVQAIGARPWLTGSTIREHYQPTTPWYLALVETCASPRVYESSIPKYLTWKDTTTITLETGEIIESERTFTVDPVARTVSVVTTGGGSSVSVPAVPSLPASVINVEHQGAVLNVESWRYPELPGRGAVDLPLKRYWDMFGAGAFACGAYASGWTAHDWRNADSPDGGSNYAVVSHSVTTDRSEIVWEGTAPWFKYDVDPQPFGGGCQANTVPGRYQYAIRCQVRQVVELSDPLEPADLIPQAVIALEAQSWAAAGASSLTFALAEEAQVASGWVDSLPCLQVVAGGVRVRRDSAARYYLISECGSVGSCVGLAPSNGETVDYLPSPAGWVVALVECGQGCLP